MLDAFVIIIATAIDDVESVHILLLLGLVRFIQCGHEEVNLVLHLFDVVAQDAPVLAGTFALLLIGQILLDWDAESGGLRRLLKQLGIHHI